jgi:hypothetical protein
MVRIVCIPPAKGSEGPEKAAEAKEIINRISIRSNQQNPIKPWNLRANDDFQMELARRFRQDKLFYERRDREWKARRSALKGVGVGRGPSIKRLMADLACYYWRNGKLGPTIAKGNLGELFQGDGYEHIREETSDELAYQVYALSDWIQYSLRWTSPKKYRTASRHIDRVVMSIVCRALSEQGAAWKKDELTTWFDKDRDDCWNQWEKAWAVLSRTAADCVLARYREAARKSKGSEEGELTLKNYVRRREEISKILSAPLPKAISTAARAVMAFE